MSRYKEISVDELLPTIQEELVSNRREIEKAMVDKTTEAMESLVKITKDTAPVGKRRKHYKNSITFKVLHKRNVGYGQAYRLLWYVKGPDYRLSHLLNNGHALRNGGRYNGTNFIGKALDQVLPEYVRALEEAIKK